MEALSRLIHFCVFTCIFHSLLKALIVETRTMKEALDIGVHTIHTAEASIKGTQSQETSLLDPPAVNNSAMNPFGDAMSVLTTEQQNQQYMRHSVQEEPPTSYYGQSAPAASSIDQEQPHQQQHQQQSGPPDQALQLLANLKDAAEQAEKDAQSATDHAQALALQVEDILREYEQANDTASKMQNSKPKKKGFMRGKKEHQKDVEAAKNLSEQKCMEVQQAHDNLGMAQRNASNMKDEASQKRAQADEYEIRLADYLTHVQQPQEPEAVPTTMSKEDFGAAARGQEYGDAPPSYQHQYVPSYGSYGDPNVSYQNPVAQQNSGMAPMGFGGHPATPARPAAPEALPMGGDQNVMGGNYNGYYNGNTPGQSIVAVDEPTSSVDQHLMGGAPTYQESYPASSSINRANIAQKPFPADSSVAGMSYVSETYSNAGISYESVPVATDTNLMQETTKTIVNSITGITMEPADASITGMSNAGSYVSVQEPSSNLNTIPAVAPLPTEYSIPPPGYGTDSSIQGSVSRAGTISGYNSVNPNPEYATDSSVQGSISNAGTISGYSSDTFPATAFTAACGPLAAMGNTTSSVFPAKPQISQNGSSEGLGGIPSPIKEDAFEPNGGLQSLDYTTSGDQSAIESKSFDSRIPTPTASNDDSFYGFASQLVAPTYSSQPIASAEQNPNVDTFITDSAHEATLLMANAEFGSEGATGSQMNDRHFAPKVETMGLGINPTSSLDGGIPTPTAPNDAYANMFG